MNEQRNNLAVFSFREVPGGFIYRAPNPRIFGECDHYFVSAAQRDEILALTPAARSPTVVGSLVGGITLALVVIVVALNVYFPGFQTTVGVIFSVLTGCLTLLALHLFAKRALRRVEPIIEHAPRTDQQVTLADIQAAQAIRPGVTYVAQKRGCKLTAFASAFSLFAAVAMVIDRRPNASLFNTPAIIFAFNAAIFAVLTLRGLRALKQRKAAENAAAPMMSPTVAQLPQRLLASLGFALFGYLIISAVIGVRSELSDLGFAQRAEKRGDHKSAIAEYSKALEASRESEAALMGRARSLIATGENVRAITDLTRMIELNPSDVEAYRLRGQASHATGQDDSAIADYSRVLELNPADFYANYFRGTSYAAKKNWDLAIADFTRAIALKTDDHFAYVARARNFQAKGDLDSAIADANRAIDLNPKYVNAFLLRASLNATKGNIDAAIADYTRYIGFKPSDAAGYISRAGLYVSKKDLGPAIADYSQVIGIQPDNYLARFTRGVLHETRSEFEPALEDFTKAIAIQPRSAAAYSRRAGIYAKRGAADLALADYSVAIQLAPKDLGVLANRAGFYEHGGKIDQAVEDYKTMITLPAAAPADVQRQEQARKSIARLTSATAGSPPARDTRP